MGASFLNYGSLWEAFWNLPLKATTLGEEDLGVSPVRSWSTYLIRHLLRSSDKLGCKLASRSHAQLIEGMNEMRLNRSG
jgi:hypothetical protein